jgi:antitoxin HicB
VPGREEEGGGWLITFPDMPGCMADGETIEEAVRNGEEVVRSWLKTAEEFGDTLPHPSKPINAGGKFNLRVPKSLHARLVRRAKEENVSMNMPAVTLLSEGLARSESGKAEYQIVTGDVLVRGSG